MRYAETETTRDTTGDGGERILTAAEFARLPEEGRYAAELVRGRLVRSPRPATYHGLLVARFARVLSEFAETGDHGVVVAEGGALLARDPDTVRGPDVAFYSHARVPKHAYATTFWGPPDLAVEIVSPSNTKAEVREKVADYLEAGVRVVWVVDPATRGATSYRPGAAAGGEPGDAEPGRSKPGGPEQGGLAPVRSDPRGSQPGRSGPDGWSAQALKSTDALACDDVLPGFRLPLAAVFGL